MNYLEACKILELSNKFNSKQLKHNYYMLALRYHPDRNLGINTNNEFQKINSAYNFLNNIVSNSNEIKDDNTKYIDLVKEFLNGIINKNLETERFINILNNKCNELTIDFLKTLPKTTLLKFKAISQEYANILNISNEIIERINYLVSECTKHDNIIILNPTLSNLLNDEVYRYTLDNETFFIPYWHHELIYDLSNSSLIIQCEPILPDCACIDKYNNLYISISSNIKDIINTDNINITIANKIYTIPVKELKIIKKQRYILKSQGISMIDINNIYTVKNKADVFIDITFTDIT